MKCVTPSVCLCDGIANEWDMPDSFFRSAMDHRQTWTKLDISHMHEGNYLHKTKEWLSSNCIKYLHLWEFICMTVNIDIPYFIILVMCCYFNKHQVIFLSDAIWENILILSTVCFRMDYNMIVWILVTNDINFQYVQSLALWTWDCNFFYACALMHCDNKTLKKSLNLVNLI